MERPLNVISTTLKWTWHKAILNWSSNLLGDDYDDLQAPYGGLTLEVLVQLDGSVAVDEYQKQDHRVEHKTIGRCGNWLIVSTAQLRLHLNHRRLVTPGSLLSDPVKGHDPQATILCLPYHDVNLIVFEKSGGGVSFLCFQQLDELTRWNKLSSRSQSASTSLGRPTGSIEGAFACFKTTSTSGALRWRVSSLSLPTASWRYWPSSCFPSDMLRTPHSFFRTLKWMAFLRWWNF